MDEREIVLMVARGELQVDEADALLEAAQRKGSQWPIQPVFGWGSNETVRANVASLEPSRPARRGKLSPDALIALASAGVTPEWIRAVREAGVEGLDTETLVGLAGSGVTPEWIRALGEAGVTLNGDTLVALAATGVTPDWILSLKEADLADLDDDTLVGLAGSDVRPESSIGALSSEVAAE
ncbi:MAG TPA: hypothetical protein VM345_10305 [Acidimicrobiales bacterium]|jgi:hypothetical protein|nr:hypothetical protein [Acidimicrobiales bacterium]